MRLRKRSNRPRYDVSVLGLSLALIGAAIMLIAVFLPRAESPAFSFGGIEQNTLLQAGDGVPFIIMALLIASSAYLGYGQGRRPWWPLVLGFAAAGLAYALTTGDNLTLYHLNPDGSVNDELDSITASAGIGIWAAGLGGVLSFIGGYVMRRESTVIDPATQATGETAIVEAPTKQCPDCAETILRDALVCKHCGYRFDATATPPLELP